MTQQGDHLIDGDWWLDAASDEYPYMRETGEWRNQQINTSAAPGEQALNGWWRKSQDSYHLGSGIRFFDTGTDPQVGYRFTDSAGVNVWEPGQVSLLRDTDKVHAATEACPLIGYSTSGGDGVLFSPDKINMVKVNKSGDVSSVAWGNTGTIDDIASSGGAYFVLASDGVHRGTLPDGAGTKMYTTTGGPFRGGRIAYAKDRLVVTRDNRVWVVGANATAGTVMPDPFFTHDESGWYWSDIVETPDGILLSGYINDRSRVYFMGIGGTEMAPEILPPRMVAELGVGEVVLAMYVYAGSLLFLGTTLGFRVAAIEQSGNLTVGPLHRTDGLCSAFAGQSDFVWAAGANVDGKQGVYRISLANVLNDAQAYSQFGTLRFPYAKDLSTATMVFDAGLQTRGIAPVGMTTRIAFSVENAGVWMEHGTRLVASGWVQTGRVRFDTTEAKIFAFGRVLHGGGPGRLQVDWLDEKAAVKTAVADYSTTGISDVRFILDHTTPHPFISLRFTLRPEGNVSPVLGEWSMKAQPSAVKQRVIRLALQCQAVEQPAGGRPSQRPVWSRLNKLEQAEATGRIVEYRNLGTGEAVYCIIDQVQFARTAIPAGAFEKQDPGGTLIVTLRTVD